MGGSLRIEKVRKKTKAIENEAIKDEAKQGLRAGQKYAWRSRGMFAQERRKQAVQSLQQLRARQDHGLLAFRHQDRGGKQALGG